MANSLEKFVPGAAYVKVNLRFKVTEKDWSRNWKCLILTHIPTPAPAKNTGVVTAATPTKAAQM